MKDKIVLASALSAAISAALFTMAVVLLTNKRVLGVLTLWLHVITGYSSQSLQYAVIPLYGVLFFVLSGTLSLLVLLWLFQDVRHRLAMLADVSAMYLAGRVGSKPAFIGVDDLSQAAFNMHQLALRLQEQARLLQHDSSTKVAQEERARIGRELHDRVSQDLFGLSLMSRALVLQEERSGGNCVAALSEIDALITKVQISLRGLLLELRPAELQERTLEQALEQLGQELTGRMAVPVSVQTFCSDQEQLDPSVEQALFLIAQQALINALRHAQATTIDVRLDREAERTVLSISDNGVGMDPQKTGVMSVGLRSMRERAQEVGGSCVWRASLSGGTEVLVIIPKSR